ncbi:helix-turn-helix transcriptional regulator [Sphingomonas sp. Root241]|uniref:helix-turn-helix transcriptional regulator n=1 Tax=Sphingomonas sp. Root241 TaxID=1736501 RepID=UPI0006FB80F7|nr:AlpA family phage regulatory protein [Sphingomonas sp. Root241]KRC81295.1 AlpA family transcriptional regulator [Sphingomonas sp. Root241]
MSDNPDRFLRLQAVLNRTGLSRTTMYRMIRNGSFPENVQLGPRCVGWRESAIESWMREPLAGTNADRRAR